MKHTHTTAAIIASVFLMGNALAQTHTLQPVLQEREHTVLAAEVHASSLPPEDATLEVAEVTAAFDLTQDRAWVRDFQKGDASVMARLAAAEKVRKGSANIELAKLYLEDKLTIAGTDRIQWKTLPEDVRQGGLTHLVTKKTFNLGDIGVARKLAQNEATDFSGLKPRAAELLGLMPKESRERYALAHRLFNPNRIGQAAEQYMKDQEILDVLGGVMDAHYYDILRKEMLARCIGAVTRTLRASKNKDSNAFDSAMEPILTTLNAPLWEGLPAAVAPYEMSLTMPDYGKLTARLTLLCNQLDERKITTSSNFAGSLMFLKGAEGYKSWIQDNTN